MGQRTQSNFAPGHMWAPWRGNLRDDESYSQILLELCAGGSGDLEKRLNS